MTLHGVPVLMTGERALFLPEAPCNGTTSGSTGGKTDIGNDASTDGSTGDSSDGSTGGSSGVTPTLILSDTHFGKAETFQEHGIPVPTDYTERDLDRLRQLVCTHDARRIIILGDLFHSTRNSSWDRVLAGFQSMKKTELMLVMGNHDIIHRSDYESIGFRCVSRMSCGPFLLQHHPPGHLVNDESFDQTMTQDDDKPDSPMTRYDKKNGSYITQDVKKPGTFMTRHDEIPEKYLRHPDSESAPGTSSPFFICGHIHPSFRIRGTARQRITVPCFWLRPGCLVLPAFGSFTGSHAVTTRPGDLVLLATGDSVIPHSLEPDV